MIKLDRPVIVEGKYDKITLENIIEATIIPTDGFSIFKDKKKCELLRILAKQNGIIIMTDSDSAGAVIRSYLKKQVGNAKITNVYIPRILGKEKRKTKAGKEGVLGVEGMTADIIKSALVKSGVFLNSVDDRPKITKADMFRVGLSGTSDSCEKRKSFLSFISLPDNLSSSAMLDVLNNMFTIEEFREKAQLWQENTDKN